MLRNENVFHSCSIIIEDEIKYLIEMDNIFLFYSEITFPEGVQKYGINHTRLIYSTLKYLNWKKIKSFEVDESIIIYTMI